MEAVKVIRKTMIKQGKAGVSGVLALQTLLASTSSTSTNLFADST
jgi:hypothetical protein